MNPIARVKATVAKDLACLKTFLDTYNATAPDSPSFNRPIVGYVAQRVLDSDEITNAMSYVKIKPDELLNRTIEHTDELLDLSNSLMTGLTIYQSNPNSFRQNIAQLGEDLVRTLEETCAPSSDETEAGSRSSVDEETGAILDRLSTQMVNAIVRLIAGIAFVYIALEHCHGNHAGGHCGSANKSFLGVRSVARYPP